MRPNMVIDDDLMKEAMALRQLKTKKAVVETGRLPFDVRAVCREITLPAP